MIILVDADEVLENLTAEWIGYLNETYGTAVRYEDIRDWNIALSFPTLKREQVYSGDIEAKVCARLRPMPDAPEYLKRLIEDGHTIYVVTNTHYRAIASKMEHCLLKYYPFLPWENYILTANKQMIRGDVLIDDGVHNLIGGSYRKLLFTAPNNADFDAEAHGMIRVNNWKEVYDVLCRMT